MSVQPFLGIHHCALRSSDPSRSVGFFEALGFRQVHHWQLPKYAIERAAMMQAPDGNSCIELFDLDAQIPMQGKAAGEGQAVARWALAHLCLMVSDLEAATDSIIAAGARQLSGPETLHLGLPAVTVHNAIFEGVAGEIIELIEKVSFPGDSPGTSTFPVSPRIVK